MSGALDERERRSPLRVAMFVNDFPTLSTTFIYQQMVALLTAGHHLDIFALRRRDEGGRLQPQLRQWSLLQRTCWLPARPRRRSTRLWRALQLWYQQRLPRYPLINTLNVARFGSAARSLTLFYAALPLIQRPPYHIIHCQFGTLGPLLADLRAAGVIEGRLLVSFRGYDATQYPAQRPGIYRRLFAVADRLLPVSDSLQQRLQALGAPADRLTRIPSGIDLERFPLQLRHPPVTPPLRLLTVARLVEKKGLAVAIAAVAQLRQQGVALHYTIIGDGPLRPALTAQIAHQQLADVVTLSGWRDQDEVRQALYQAHIFLMPSLTAADGDAEGIPNALKEAMASGMPVIATDHAGIPELVSDGVSGLLVAEGKCDALAAAVQQLLAAPARWAALGVAARAAVAAHFSQPQAAQQLLDCYYAVLRQPVIG